MFQVKITKLPKIIAVSKTFELEKITPLIDYGHLDYGENKVQESFTPFQINYNKNSIIDKPVLENIDTVIDNFGNFGNFIYIIIYKF